MTKQSRAVRATLDWLRIGRLRLRCARNGDSLECFYALAAQQGHEKHECTLLTDEIWLMNSELDEHGWGDMNRWTAMQVKRGGKRHNPVSVKVMKGNARPSELEVARCPGCPLRRSPKSNGKKLFASAKQVKRNAVADHSSF